MHYTDGKDVISHYRRVICMCLRLITMTDSGLFICDLWVKIRFITFAGEIGKHFCLVFCKARVT